MVLTFCIINYRHTKRQLTAATAVLFLFYILDNIIIYMTEFLDGFSVRYDLQFMSAPAFKTLIFLVTSFCLVSIQHQVLPRRRKNRDTAALVLLGLSLLFLSLIHIFTSAGTPVIPSAHSGVYRGSVSLNAA